MNMRLHLDPNVAFTPSTAHHFVFPDGEILASRHNAGPWPVPLTRRDLYAQGDGGALEGDI